MDGLGSGPIPKAVAFSFFLENITPFYSLFGKNEAKECLNAREQRGMCVEGLQHLWLTGAPKQRNVWV